MTKEQTIEGEITGDVISVIKEDVATTQDNLFKTSKGVVIEYKGISPFKLQLLQGQTVVPDKPTYTVTTATGKKETFYIDEEVAPTIDFGKQIWNTYQENRIKALETQNTKVTEAIFRMGAKIISWGNVEGWQEDYVDLGITLPEKPRDLEVFYLKNELTGTEITTLLNSIMKLSGVSEDDIKKAEETFRS